MSRPLRKVRRASIRLAAPISLKTSEIAACVAIACWRSGAAGPSVSLLTHRGCQERAVDQTLSRLPRESGYARLRFARPAMVGIVRLRQTTREDSARYYQ